MTGLTKETKLAVLAEASWCCYYCAGAAESVDHVVALSTGGTNSRSNLVAACIPCNQAKAALPQHLFMRFVAIQGSPDGHRWYRGTNAFTARVIANIASRVDFDKTVEVVFHRLADEDPVRSATLLRRALFRMGMPVNENRLQSVFADLAPPVLAP